eukprot:10715995-Karenia_brevis.AAC.1
MDLYNAWANSSDRPCRPRLSWLDLRLELFMGRVGAGESDIRSGEARILFVGRAVSRVVDALDDAQLLSDVDNLLHEARAAAGTERS